MTKRLTRLWRAYRRDPKSLFLRLIVCFAALITILALVFMIAYILMKGIPNLTVRLFEARYTTENVSLLPALINTLFMILLSLVFAVPAGIGAAVYLTEYAGCGSRLARIVGITAETLSGIPSIVYGLFGSLFFVKYLGLGLSLLSGAFTLSIMILPLIMRTTEEAIRSVPDSYREGSFGLGAGKLRTVFSIVLPCAVPHFFRYHSRNRAYCWGICCTDLYCRYCSGYCRQYFFLSAYFIRSYVFHFVRGAVY